MGNKKKPPRQRRQRPAVHPGELMRRDAGEVSLPPGLDAAFNRAARKSCSECGAPVRWVDAAAAAEHGLDVDQAVQFLGGSAAGLEFWVCTSCDNAGVMGGGMASF
jgi:hypothetical protein